MFRAYFDVTEAGNAAPGSAHGFETMNILHVDHSVEEVIGQLNATPERLSEAIERGRRILFEARALADEILARFWDDEAGGFFGTASDQGDEDKQNNSFCLTSQANCSII